MVTSPVPGAMIVTSARARFLRHSKMRKDQNLWHDLYKIIHSGLLTICSDDLSSLIIVCGLGNLIIVAVRDERLPVGVNKVLDPVRVWQTGQPSHSIHKVVVFNLLDILYKDLLQFSLWKPLGSG